jgi:CheY-like chemotaxis protein
VDACRQQAPDTPVILVTAFGTVDEALEAIRRGAADYLSKPYDVDAIKVVVARALKQRALALENRTLRRDLRDKYRLENVVGRSESMLQVFKTAARVASTDATVLIQGESGTGKELVARAIHQSSPRAAGPFVAVDCGAIAEGVLESELFGHARGAFTGAQAMRRGLFEEASGGTIFLDEIGDVGPNLQARLLRALQEGTIRRVGTNEPIAVDVRVVAATNRDLEQAVKEGTFRADLYYRLNVINIRIPPLRERREDVPLLAEHLPTSTAAARSATAGGARPAGDLPLAWQRPGAGERHRAGAGAQPLRRHPPRRPAGGHPRRAVRRVGASGPHRAGASHPGGAGGPLRQAGASRDRRQQEPRRGHPRHRPQDRCTAFSESESDHGPRAFQATLRGALPEARGPEPEAWDSPLGRGRPPGVVEGVLQDLAGTEGEHPPRGDLDLPAGLGVATHAGLLVADDEVPEASDLDLLAALERLLYGVEHHLHDLGGLLLGEAHLLVDALDDIRLGHGRLAGGVPSPP